VWGGSRGSLTHGTDSCSIDFDTGECLESRHGDLQQVVTREEGGRSLTFQVVPLRIGDGMEWVGLPLEDVIRVFISISESSGLGSSIS